MGDFTVETKNTMLDSFVCDSLSLHSDDPGADGTLNELTGGDPAYARQSAVYNAAGSGERLLDADVTFDVPGDSTVAYVGKWTYDADTPVFRGADAVTAESYADQGEYTVKATTSKLALDDVVA